MKKLVKGFALVVLIALLGTTFILPQPAHANQNVEVVLKPTAQQQGEAKVEVEPGIFETVVLPALSVEDYTVSHDSFDQQNAKITYTLKNTENGIIEVDYDLPAQQDEGFIWSVYTVPTLTTKGLMAATHNSFPGLEIEFDLPMFNLQDYTENYANPEAGIGYLQYEYLNINLNGRIFEFNLLDTSNLVVQGESITFFAQTSMQYWLMDYDKMQEFLSEGKTTLEEHEWQQVIVEIEEGKFFYEGQNNYYTFSGLALEHEYAIYAKPFFSAPLRGYPAIIVETKAFTNAELEDAKQEAENQIITAFSAYNETDYYPEDWLELVEIKEEALLQLQSMLQLEEVETFALSVNDSFKSVLTIKQHNDLIERNFWPFIFILAGLIIIELAITAVIFAKKNKNKNMLAIAPLTLMLASTSPKQAVLILALLGVGLIASTALMLYTIFKYKGKPTQKKHEASLPNRPLPPRPPMQ